MLVSEAFGISFLTILLVHTNNTYRNKNFRALEIGETVGFLIVIAYALFFGSSALKIFTLLDTALIVIRRITETKKFLKGNLFTE